MTKIILTVGLFILCLNNSIQAQTYDSIAHHKTGWYDIDMRDDMIQLYDGSILAHVQLFEVDGNGNYLGDYGNRFYKISRNGAVITDSVFIEDNDLNWFLLKRNPLAKDHIFAKLVRNKEEYHTDLCIRFFDDNLNFLPEKEVWIPVSDTLFPPLRDAYTMDEQGNIIFFCHISDHVLFMRVGLDGVVKDRSEIPYSSFPISALISGQRMGSFHTPSGGIGYWGYNSDLSRLNIIALDSSLHMTEVFEPYDAPTGMVFDYGMKDRVLDWDSNTFLVASQFHNVADINDGVCLTRYDKNTLSAINTRCFRTFPQVLIGNGSLGRAFPFGLAKTGDGNMYFAYCTQDPTSQQYGLEPCGLVSVVKMDADFHIIWQRFCLELYGYSRIGSDLAVLDDGGVSVAGVIIGTPPEVFFLSFNDEGWGTTKAEFPIRPYTYYPNPAKDALHLQYSPDVTPKQIELYDLQGRLVRSQRSSLESLDMEGLAAGTYTLRVTLEDGQVFSDKVVKE